MSTLQVNTLDSYSGSTINVDSTADLQLDSTTTAASNTSGALTVVGGISTQENLYVGGNAVITGTMTANGGTITLGDAGTDNVTFGGEINSDVIPDATNTYDLGSSSKKWAEIHATTFTGNITGDVTGNVSGTITGNADTATALAATKTIGMTGDVVWTSGGFDGSGNVTGTATIQANSVALGTDTTGNYMDDLSAGTGVTITHTPSEGSTGTVAIGQSVATSATPSFTGMTITGTDFLTIPDGTNAQRGSPSRGSIRYSVTDTTFEGYDGSNWGSLGGVKDVDGDTYITAENSAGSDEDVLTLVAGGTTGLTVSATTTTIAGNLTVSGTTTTINTETINLADNTIVLNSNEAGTPSQDGGIEIERGTSTNKSLLWDETNDKWTVGSETMVAGTFEGSIAAASVTGLASVVSDEVNNMVGADYVSSNTTTAYTTADWGNLTTSTGTAGFANEPQRASSYQDLALPATTTTVDWGALA
jgi:hypothetical protein